MRSQYATFQVLKAVLLNTEVFRMWRCVVRRVSWSWRLYHLPKRLEALGQRPGVTSRKTWIFKTQYVFCEVRMARVVYISATFHSVTTQWLVCIPHAVTLINSAIWSRGIFVFRMIKGKVYRGYRCTFPGVRRPGRVVDRSSPSTAEVKNEWSYTSTSLYTLMACYGEIFTLNGKASSCPRRKGM